MVKGLVEGEASEPLDVRYEQDRRKPSTTTTSNDYRPLVDSTSSYKADTVQHRLIGSAVIRDGRTSAQRVVGRYWRQRQG